MVLLVAFALSSLSILYYYFCQSFFVSLLAGMAFFYADMSQLPPLLLPM